jgi:hypothetical protein
MSAKRLRHGALSTVDAGVSSTLAQRGQFGADGFFTDRPELGFSATGHAGTVDVDALLKSLGY